MYPSTMVQLTDVCFFFLIGFGQQWGFMAQRNKQYKITLTCNTQSIVSVVLILGFVNKKEKIYDITTLIWNRPTLNSTHRIGVDQNGQIV